MATMGGDEFVDVIEADDDVPCSGSKTPCEDIGTLHQPQSCSRRSRLVDTRSKSEAIYDVGEELPFDI